MDGSSDNYHKEFLKSPHHLWLGLGTLGAGFLLATPLTLIIGATAYALGWIYLPDLALFKRWVDRRSENRTARGRAGPSPGLPQAARDAVERTFRNAAGALHGTGQRVPRYRNRHGRKPTRLGRADH